MKVFALADLHLSFAEKGEDNNWQNVKENKPMAVFGPAWQQHPQQIFANWQETVAPNDVVLVAGDISWGMNFADCVGDFDFLSQLPGKIVLCRGNHDYWWGGIGKVRAALPANVTALQNDACLVGSRAICGTRGWLSPGSYGFAAQDKKIFAREVLRLKMALAAGAKMADRLVVLTHYPPFNDRVDENAFNALMHSYGVERCVFGHIHGAELLPPLPKEKWGIQFDLTSADWLDFKPALLWEE